MCVGGRAQVSARICRLSMRPVSLLGLPLVNAVPDVAAGFLGLKDGGRGSPPVPV